MRIISGFLKGKKINFLKTTTTRPLRDFIKENIFNIINHSNLINIELENARVLDVYSGVGSFGIECISRGAKKTTFIEKDIDAQTILKKNLSSLKIEERSEIFKESTTKFFKRMKNNDKFEILFFDPPFSENFFIDELKVLKNSTIYKKNHLIVIHREISSRDPIDEIITILLTRTYGRSKVIFGTF
jgi:16S rRNA (guanine966-N2)-methyltransferase